MIGVPGDGARRGGVGPSLVGEPTQGCDRGGRQCCSVDDRQGREVLLEIQVNCACQRSLVIGERLEAFQEGKFAIAEYSTHVAKLVLDCPGSATNCFCDIIQSVLAREWLPMEQQRMVSKVCLDGDLVLFVRLGSSSPSHDAEDMAILTASAWIPMKLVSFFTQMRQRSRKRRDLPASALRVSTSVRLAYCPRALRIVQGRGRSRAQFQGRSFAVRGRRGGRCSSR